jgi:hypothetical protein
MSQTFKLKAQSSKLKATKGEMVWQGLGMITGGKH